MGVEGLGEVCNGGSALWYEAWGVESGWALMRLGGESLEEDCLVWRRLGVVLVADFAAVEEGGSMVGNKSECTNIWAAENISEGTFMCA